VQWPVPQNGARGRWYRIERWRMGTSRCARAWASVAPGGVARGRPSNRAAPGLSLAIPDDRTAPDGGLFRPVGPDPVPRALPRQDRRAGASL